MRYLFIFCVVFKASYVLAQADVETIDVVKGWADNSVNATVFRKNSLVTFKDTQFVAFYDDSANVIIGKGKLKTQTGNCIVPNTRGMLAMLIMLFA